MTNLYVPVKITAHDTNHVHEVMDAPTTYERAMRQAIESPTNAAVWSLYTGRIMHPVLSDLRQAARLRTCPAK